LKQTLRVTQPALLEAFLFEQLSTLKKTRVRQLLKFGCVSINGRVSTKYNFTLKAGDEVRVVSSKIKQSPREEPSGLDILYEDDDLIAISKPEGLLSVATEKVQGDTAIAFVNSYVNHKASAVFKRTPYQKSVFIVHRLDRDVSGVMLFAKSEEVKHALQENWGAFTKCYEAVVEGGPENASGTQVSYLKEDKILHVSSGPERPGARRAETHFEVLDSGKRYSLLAVQLGTGRKHQIRVHLRDLGCPVAGDRHYGAQTNPLKRIALHACRLEITHPVSDEPLVINSPAPATFKQIVTGKK